MAGRAATVLLGVASLTAAAPSAAAPSSARPVQIVIERVHNTGPASFRLDLTVEPGDSEGFIGGVQTKLDKHGRPVKARPLPMTSLNEHREPTVYAGGTTASTCGAGVCQVGRTAAAGVTVVADDAGPAEMPIVVLAVVGQKTDWTFTGSNYRLRVVPARFRYVTGEAANSVGVDYIGTGAELYIGDATVTGAGRGSLAVAAAPCSTSGSGLLARGVGTLTLEGGPHRVQETCPRDDGVIAQGAPAATTWRVSGPAGGDGELRGARLLVVDLPLR